MNKTFKWALCLLLIVSVAMKAREPMQADQDLIGIPEVVQPDEVAVPAVNVPAVVAPAPQRTGRTLWSCTVGGARGVVTAASKVASSTGKVTKALMGDALLARFGRKAILAGAIGIALDRAFVCRILSNQNNTMAHKAFLTMGIGTLGYLAVQRVITGVKDGWQRVSNMIKPVARWGAKKMQGDTWYGASYKIQDHIQEDREKLKDLLEIIGNGALRNRFLHADLGNIVRLGKSSMPLSFDKLDRLVKDDVEQRAKDYYQAYGDYCEALLQKNDCDRALADLNAVHGRGKDADDCEVLFGKDGDRVAIEWNREREDFDKVQKNQDEADSHLEKDRKKFNKARSELLSYFGGGKPQKKQADMVKPFHHNLLLRQAEVSADGRADSQNQGEEHDQLGIAAPGGPEDWPEINIEMVRDSIRRAGSN